MRMAPHRLLHVNAWPPVGRTLLKELGNVALLEGVSLRVGLEVSIAQAIQISVHMFSASVSVPPSLSPLPLFLPGASG